MRGFIRSLLGPQRAAVLGSYLRDPMQGRIEGMRRCNVCDFEGRFLSSGVVVSRRQSRCPRCLSLERHRLLCLVLERYLSGLSGRTVLHFAPEPPVTWFIAERLDSTRYVTADLDGRDVDCHEDLQRLTLDDRSFDVVIACDVLEHIPDDCAAIHEVFRVLRPGGAFIVTVPQVLAWKATYEDAAIIAPTERERHFGQRNHLRWYGADFTDRLLTAGFEAEVVDSLPAECAEYALEPGRRAYVAVRPRA